MEGFFLSRLDFTEHTARYIPPRCGFCKCHVIYVSIYHAMAATTACFCRTRNKQWVLNISSYSDSFSDCIYQARMKAFSVVIDRL